MQLQEVKPDFGSAFTPGAGDANSVFIPISSTPVEYEFSIFNRWGDRIFYTNRKEGWGGKLKDGSYAPDGNYVWFLIYKDGDGVMQRKKIR